MKTSTVVKLSGLLGLGLVIAGGIMVYRDRKRSQLGLHRYVAGRFGEAPVVDSFTDGDTSTTLRASENMPIEERIGSIQKMIYKSVQDPEMRKLALHITRGCPERDGKCEAKKIYKWMKGHLRYTGDIAPVKHPNGDVEGIDLYMSARRAIEAGGEDCDGHAIVGGTLLSLNGITAKLRVTAECETCDESHIYVGAVLPKLDPKNFIALDTTLPGSYNFGVEAPAARITDYDA